MKQKKSEMEDIRVEITGAEQNKEKEWKKKCGPSQRSLEQCKVHGHSNFRGSRRRIERQSVWENIWKHCSQKLPEHRKENSHPTLGSAQCLIRIKPEEKHTKIHITATNKN